MSSVSLRSQMLDDGLFTVHTLTQTGRPSCLREIIVDDKVDTFWVKIDVLGLRSSFIVVKNGKNLPEDVTWNP